jgi:hypothetical protein
MKWPEAEALITEAHKLGYRGTDWEKGFIARLELMQPAVLLSEDAKSVEEFYRRASGGGHKVFRKTIGSKHRYNPVEVD